MQRSHSGDAVSADVRTAYIVHDVYDQAQAPPCLNRRKTSVAGNGDTRWSNWKPTQRTLLNVMCVSCFQQSGEKSRKNVYAVHSCFVRHQVALYHFYACGLNTVRRAFILVRVFFVVVVVGYNTVFVRRERRKEEIRIRSQ